MVIGCRVKANKRAYKISDWPGNRVQWVSAPISVEKAVFLGWSYKRNGDWHYDHYGNREYFTSRERVKVLALQPIDKSGRWLKPVFAFPEDVEETND